MKECDQARRLGAYHDGELPAAQREPIESHLAGCPSCRTELRGIAAMSDLLRTAAGADVPPGLLERLHEAVEALRDRLVRRFAYRVAAAAALLACAVWL